MKVLVSVIGALDTSRMLILHAPDKESAFQTPQYFTAVPPILHGVYGESGIYFADLFPTILSIQNAVPLVEYMLRRLALPY